MSDWHTTRARIAATKRHHPGADTSVLEGEHRAARAEDYIKKLVDSAPPLSADQRGRLAVLLLSGGGVAA